MSVARRILYGFLLLPGLIVLFIGACIGRIAFDQWRYKLPGEVLASPERPTRTLASAFEVAETLDSYVQPRFEILRDKNFGALRIVYRKHAGIVQLKVDTPEEKKLIANANAARRDYAISLLHCAPKPSYYGGITDTRFAEKPKLQLLYFNQKEISSDWDHGGNGGEKEKQMVTQHGLALEDWEKKAVAALPELKQGKEVRITDGKWDILFRPTLATKTACIDCHTDAKVGNTLGVMAYAVRKVTRSEAKQVSQR